MTLDLQLPVDAATIRKLLPHRYPFLLVDRVVAGRMFYMVKVENARFTRMVVPGDRLDLDVTLKRLIRNMAFYTGVASVNGEQVACADVLCAEDTR